MKSPLLIIHFHSRSEIAVMGCGFQTEVNDGAGGLGSPDHLTCRAFVSVEACSLESGGRDGRHPSRLALPEQEIQDHGQHDRQDDAGGDRNVDGHASTSKREIPRQIEPTEQHQAPADHGQEHAKDKKQPPDVLHLSREQFLSRSEIAVAGCGFQTEATMAPGGRGLPGHLTNRPFHNVGAHDLRS
jgi:hypothetical protein